MTQPRPHDPYASLLPGGVRPWFWTVLSALTVARIVSAATLDLHPDEAYYWLWSTRLSGGYYDHPYGVALLIRLTTLLSDGEFWVRLGGLLGMLALTAAVWDMVRRQTGSRDAGYCAGLLLNAGIAFSAGAVVMTPDTPMILSWGAGIYALFRLLHGGSPWWWVAVGTAFGAGMASKYTMVFFAGVVVGCLALSRSLRRTLTLPAAALGLAAAAAAVYPVVAWNARHGFISFLFQAGHGLGEGKPSSPLHAIELIAGQAAILTPLVAGALVWAQASLLRRWWGSRDDRLLLWWVGCAPWAVIIAFLSLKAKIEQNWPLFAWYAAVAGYLIVLDPRRPSQRRYFRWALGTSLAGVILVHLHLLTPVIAIDGRDPADDFHGWREIGAELRYQQTGMPEAALTIASRHQLAAELAYYGPRDLPVTDWPGEGRFNQFDLWMAGRRPPTGDIAFYVEDDPAGPPPAVRGLGTSFELLQAVDVLRGRHVARRVTYHLVRGFRGFPPAGGGGG